MGTLSKEFALRKISQIERDFGIIASKKRLERSQRATSMEVVKRNWLLLVRQGRGKERVLERRVTMMEDHHSQRRRRT
jgi:hypothetical protein